MLPSPDSKVAGLRWPLATTYRGRRCSPSTMTSLRMASVLRKKCAQKRGICVSCFAPDKYRWDAGQRQDYPGENDPSSHDLKQLRRGNTRFSGKLLVDRLLTTNANEATFGRSGTVRADAARTLCAHSNCFYFWMIITPHSEVSLRCWQTIFQAHDC